MVEIDSSNSATQDVANDAVMDALEAESILDKILEVTSFAAGFLGR